MTTLQFRIFRVVGICGLLLVLSFHQATAQTNVTEPALLSHAEDAPASADVLRAYLHLQEQIHTAQMTIDAAQSTIERTREEAKAADFRNEQALSNRLAAIEKSLMVQHANEMTAMQSTNRVVLIVLGTFAGLGLLSVLLTVYFHWRAIHRFSEITSLLPPGRAFGSMPARADIGLREDHLVTAGHVEQSNARLCGIIERLEKRVIELEQVARPSLPEPSSAPDGELSDDQVVSDEDQPSLPLDRAAQISLLLDKGQSLFNFGQAEDAVACFDDVLALDANNAEALVKKGAALEKLRKLQEAIDCYDRAIAADGSMTIAYLYKGGLCNRMERFNEAMECYEQALRTQEKKRAA